jgi:hypothetical protein
VAIAFKWGNSHHGTAGSIVNLSTIDIGVTNKRFNNGPFAQGDCLIAAVLVRGNTGVDPGAISVPDFETITDNWNATTGIRLWAGRRLAGASESGSYAATWTSVDSPGIGWLLLSFSGVDQENPIDTFAQQNNTTSTQTHPVPSITPNFADSYWIAIEGRIGANVPDIPSAPLVLLYDALGNSSAGRPEISSAGLQLASTSPTGVGVFTQAAFTQPSQGISIALAAVPQIIVPPAAGGAGHVVGRKRKRKEEVGARAFARRPLSEMYKPAQFFDFEEDDETVVLLTI